MTYEKINGEPVELVTAFEQLEAGTIVWALECSMCGGKHRLLLLRLVVAVALYGDGSRGRDELIWTCEPGAHGRRTGITSSSVDLELVYRVVDPLLTKKVEREREREDVLVRW